MPDAFMDALGLITDLKALADKGMLAFHWFMSKHPEISNIDLCLRGCYLLEF